MKYIAMENEAGLYLVVEEGTNKPASDKTYTRKDSAKKAAARLNAKLAEANEELKPEAEEQPEVKAESTVIKAELRAFTGMLLGIYEVQETSKGYKVVTKSGKTLNFNKQGEQIGVKNYSFANKLVLC